MVLPRTGYFAPPKTTVAPALTAREKLEREVTGASMLSDIPITLTYRMASTQKVKTQVHVGIDKLSFPSHEGRRVQHLTFVTALIDGSGSIVAAKDGTMDFALTDMTYLALQGVRY